MEELDLSREPTSQELRKIEVETENLIQDAALRKDKSESEIAKTKAEARRFVAEAERAEAETRVAVIDAKEAERAYNWDQAKDKYNHVYRFWSEFEESSVAKCIGRLNAWRRTDPECDITLILSSPGGSVIDGLALWDFLTELKDEDHYITTVAQGWAASMAGVLLQAGDERIMGKEAYVLIHPIADSHWGTLGSFQDNVRVLEMMEDRMLNIFATRMADSTRRTFEQAKALVKKESNRRDWWLDSKEAKRLGIVDTIR